MPRNTQPEVWGGIECARVRVRRRIVDQLELTGHDRRDSDMDLLASLGVRAARYPALWERVAPRGLANADWAWTDARLARLRHAGIRPILGLLHHGSGPRGMSLSHPGFVSAFARFAGSVAQRYPWVDTYVPVNEPLTTARFAGLYALWSPHARSDVTFARLLVTQCLAIRAAMESIRLIRSDASLLVNEDVGRTYGTQPLGSLVDHLNERRWLTWDLLTGTVVPGHPMWPTLALSPSLIRDLHDLAARPCPPDTMGVDHYVTSDRFLDHRLDRYPAAVRPGPGGGRHVDVEAVRVAGVPGDGMALAIDDTWRRYHRPIVLAEVALAGEPADQVAWWQDAWSAASAALAAGARIEAVTAWAVLGSAGWSELLCGATRYEPGCFDVSSDRVRARPLAQAVRHVATGERVHDPDLGRYLGWWTRDDRYLYAAPDQQSTRAA